ncbi:MAG: response regulator [Chitinophagia bacterium]|nr:response regulator [Chitinophagia bacterium]
MHQTIILIDDELLSHQLSSIAIKAVFPGTRLLKYMNADEAFDAIMEHIEDYQQHPPIIFLDIMMPVVDGFEFLERMSGPNSHLFEQFKVIMLTSSIRQQDKNRAFMFPIVRSYLEKPLDKQALSYLKLW